MRRVLSAKQRALRKSKQRAPISIGETRDEQQAREHRLEVAVIHAVHEWIWHQRPYCQLCHGMRQHECLGPDEMHEDPPRSKTRGLPPEQRFNLLVCGRLCQACHSDVTHRRLTIVFLDPLRRFMGPIISKPGGKHG